MPYFLQRRRATSSRYAQTMQPNLQLNIAGIVSLRAAFDTVARWGATYPSDLHEGFSPKPPQCDIEADHQRHVLAGAMLIVIAIYCEATVLQRSTQARPSYTGILGNAWEWCCRENQRVDYIGRTEKRRKIGYASFSHKFARSFWAIDPARPSKTGSEACRL